jgi:hypothetical protein
MSATKLRHLRRFAVGVLAVALFASCHNKHAFDFSRFSDIEANGHWGVPLVDAEYTIGDILSLTEGIEYIHVNDNGTMEIRYQYQKDSVISADYYMDIFAQQSFSASESQSFSGSGQPAPAGTTVPLLNDTLSLSFPSDQVILNSATAKTGILQLNIQYDLTCLVQIEITCPQLVSYTNQPYHVIESCSTGNFSTTLDFGGYTINALEGNTVEFYIRASTVSDGNPYPAEVSFNYTVTVSQMSFSRIEGNFVRLDLPFDETWDFDLAFLRQHVTGTMQIYNPQVVLEVMNTFPVDADITLNEASLSGPGVTSSIISSNEAHVHVPASTSVFTPQNLPLASSILLSPDYSSFRLRGSASVNTPGINAPTHLVFTDQQLISLRISVTLPLRVSADHITFCDTLDFSSGIDLPDEPAFSNLGLRLGLYNGLPLSFGMQVYFFDSQTQTVRDSLFSNPQPVLAAVNGTPRLTELFAAKEDLYAVQRLLNCDAIILRASLNTDNQPVIINANQTLGVELSASVNVDVNELVHSGL